MTGPIEDARAHLAHARALLMSESRCQAPGLGKHLLECAIAEIELADERLEEHTPPVEADPWPEGAGGKHG